LVPVPVRFMFGHADLTINLRVAISPKGVVSVGDGKWHLPLGDIPEALRLYLRCDTLLVAYCFYVLIVCWVFHVMPEFDVVARLSAAKTPRHLLAWWVTHLVDGVAASLGAPGLWAGRLCVSSQLVPRTNSSSSSSHRTGPLLQRVDAGTSTPLGPGFWTYCRLLHPSTPTSGHPTIGRWICLSRSAGA
jgi:hypothetical protein